MAVTGSIATDHLMRFPGRFADSLVVEQLNKISLSFLVDDLEIRRGGVAANIAFGLAGLGVRSTLVGSVGTDFGDYREWLERHGVDTSAVTVSATAHTARFVCTTDADNAQFASFYAGAMSEASNIELGPIADRVGGLDLVVISPNDPEAMMRHTRECRSRRLPFAADPSQQLAWMDGEQIRDLIDGAQYLFTNDYEAALVEKKTGWSAEDILAHVQVRVITRGKDGVTVQMRGREPISVPAAGERQVADPTGVGDAFRAGFLAGRTWDLSLERCAQVGAMLATYVLETIGTQEYHLDPDDFARRLGACYGEDAQHEVAAHIASVAAR